MEKFVEILFYSKIVAPFAIAGFGLGFLATKYMGSAGYFLLGVLSVLGIALGLKVANSIRRKQSALDFSARVNASPDIDEAVREK